MTSASLFAPVRQRLASGGLSTGFLTSAGWGMADQALISLANFLTMLFLARELTKNTFGEFVLVYTAFQLLIGFHSALISQPHNVLGVRYQGEAYRTYSSTSFYSQVWFAGASAIFFGLLGFASLLLWTDSAAMLLFLLVFGAPSWQLQEFFRRVMYTEGRPGAAFRNDVLSYGGQGLVVVALVFTTVITGPEAIVAVAATSAMAAGYGFLQTRRSFNWKLDRGLLRENWLYSRWLVAAVASSLAGTSSYPYMIALVAGPAETATVAAVAILMRPVGVINSVLDTMVPTFLARTGFAGSAGLQKKAYLPVLLSLPVVVVYTCLVMILGNGLLEFFYGGTYRNESALIVLMSVLYLLQYSAVFVNAVLKVFGATNVVFIAAVATSILTLTLGWFLVSGFSAEGAIVCLILNNLLFIAIGMVRIRRKASA